MENKTKEVVAHRKISNIKKGTAGKAKTIKKTANLTNRNKKLKPMVIINYIFIISLVFSIIFGMQTNMNFLIPFVIVLIITIVCMGIILVNAIYSKIKKIMNKSKK